MRRLWTKKRIWNGAPLGFERDGTPLAQKGNGTLLILGPPGSNKTVGTAMCEALDEPGERSYVFFDPKGEIAAVTANYRRRVCGRQNVRIINPNAMLANERPDLKSDGYNPIGHLDPDAPEFEEDCAAVGHASVTGNPNARDPHWDEGGRSAITATTMDEAMTAREQNRPPSLARVRATLTQEPVALKKSIRKMMQRDRFGITSRLGKFLAETTEIENLKSTIEVQTSWLTDAMCRDQAVVGGVDFRECRKRPTTVHIIVPAHEMKPQFIRLCLSAALRACFTAGGVPVTLFIDEGFILAHHAEIEKALAILRYLDCRMSICFQSLTQARQLYSATWGMFTSSAVLSFRPADTDTAEWLVRRAGDHWMPTRSVGEPGPNDVSERITWKAERRQRIPLDKMFGMPQGYALAWLPNESRYHIVRVPGYFSIPTLNSRADPNPYYSRV